MANFSWGSQKEVTVDQIFMQYHISPMKKFYAFGEYAERVFTKYGYKIV